MKAFSLSAASVAALALFLTGCGSAQNGTPVAAPQVQHAGHNEADDHEKAEQQANIAKLSDEDRPLAEAQGYCAVTAQPLGSMGPPIKLVVNEQPVFVCCKGCEKKAKSNPDKTLAKVEELKAKVKSESMN